MTTARYFTDEDVYAAIAVSLRKAGLDAVSTPEAGRLGESDESLLAYAANNGRVLVTFNVAHFYGVACRLAGQRSASRRNRVV